MSQSESGSAPVTFNVTIADASHLPIHYVNALVLRAGSDEFFFTLGVVMPPDQSEVPAAIEAGHLVAQPICRFAITRQTMLKFLNLMASQYDQQTALLQQLQHPGEETSKEEVSGND